jgi:hypothetical protein
MKTKFLILFLLSIPILGQTIDTSKFAFVQDKQGYYSLLTNRSVYLGKPARTTLTEIKFDITLMDTSAWSFFLDDNGYYSKAKNRAVYYGKAIGTVIVNLFYQANHNDTITLQPVPNLYDYLTKDTNSTITGNDTVSGNWNFTGNLKRGGVQVYPMDTTYLHSKIVDTTYLHNKVTYLQDSITNLNDSIAILRIALDAQINKVQNNYGYDYKDSAFVKSKAIVTTTFTISDGTTTLYGDSSDTFLCSLTHTTSLTLSLRDGQGINLKVSNTGTFTLAFSGGSQTIDWGTAGTPTQSSHATDIYTFLRVGTVIYGKYSQGFSQ